MARPRAAAARRRQPRVLEERLGDAEAEGRGVHRVAGARQGLIVLHLAGELGAPGEFHAAPTAESSRRSSMPNGGTAGTRSPWEKAKRRRERLPGGDGEGDGAVAIEPLGVEIEAALEAEADRVQGREASGGGVAPHALPIRARTRSAVVKKRPAMGGTLSPRTP